MNNKKKVLFFASKRLSIYDNNNLTCHNLVKKEIQRGEKIDFSEHDIHLTLYAYYSEEISTWYVVEELSGMSIGRGISQFDATIDASYNTRKHKDKIMNVIERNRKEYKELSWIGVDLDGTLAQYPQSINDIGKPIKKMVDRVKKWHEEEITVKIVTARVSRNRVMSRESNIIPDKKFVEEQIKIISEWCEKYLGFVPEITDRKDFNMIQLWDDRAVTVNPETGTIIKAIEAKF